MACFPNEHNYTHVSATRFYCTKCGDAISWPEPEQRVAFHHVTGPVDLTSSVEEPSADEVINDYEATITRLMQENPDFAMAMDSVASKLAEDRVHPSVVNVPVNDPLDDSLDRDLGV